MKTKTWICLILSGFLLYGLSASAGGAQCAAAAKEAAAKANASEETKAEATAETREVPVVREEALALTISEESLETPVVTDIAVDIELSKKSVEVPIVKEADSKTEKSTPKNSEEEVVEKSK